MDALKRTAYVFQTALCVHIQRQSHEISTNHYLGVLFVKLSICLCTYNISNIIRNNETNVFLLIRDTRFIEVEYYNNENYLSDNQ